jgi:N-acetyl-anhydromuramyl-L-alanine amidase AmpD
MANGVLDEAVKRQRTADQLLADSDSSDYLDEVPSGPVFEPITAESVQAQPESETQPEPVYPTITSEGTPYTNPNAQSISDYLDEVPSGPDFEPKTAEQVQAQPEAEPAPGEVQPAPDVLTQVERGELVRLPPEVGGFPISAEAPQEPAAAPDRLAQVERAQLVKLPTGQPAPDRLTQVERGQLVDPEAAYRYWEAQAAGLSPSDLAGQITAAPLAPAAPALAQPSAQPAANPNAQSLSDYLGTAQQPTVARAIPAGAAPPIQRAQLAAVEPPIDYQAQPGSYQPYRGAEPRVIKNIVLHASDGRSEQGDINTLTTGGVSAHYYTTVDGRRLHLVNDNDIAYHAGKTINPDQYSNANTIGIEQQHVDGTPWSEAEVRGTAQTVAELLKRYPYLTIDNVLGHSDIAPGRKQDPLDFPWDRFRSYVARDLGQQPQVAAVPSAQPATKQANGFYQNEDPNTFLSGHATTFATPQDVASGQDNGVGAPRLGGIDTTQAAGIAVPLETLQQLFGNNYAAMRRARVDVVDPATGKRLRLAIVDFGPSTNAVADMTPFVSQYFGGDKTLAFKIVPNAGPDVVKNPGLWADEQAAIRQGYDSSQLQPGVQKVRGAANYQLGPPLDPAQQALLTKQDQANQQNQRQSLLDLSDQYKNNPIELYNRLAQPVPGVSDPMRQQYQDNIKTELTKYAQDYYNIKDPNEAFQRITSEPGPFDYPAQAAKDIIGHGFAMVANFNANLASKDEDNVRKMLALVNPNAAPDQISTAMKALTNPDLSHHDRERLIRDNIMVPYSQLDQAHQSTFDLAAGVESLRNLSNPQYVAERQKTIDAQVGAVNNLLRPDPRLNPVATHIIDVVSQLPAIGVQLATGPLGGSLMLSDIYKGTLDKLQVEHPEMSDDQRQDLAGRNALVQAGIMYASGGAGKLFEGFIGDIENAAVRAGARVGVHAGAGGLTMITARAAENLITGQPVTAGLSEAAITGAGLGAIGGIRGGRAPAEVQPAVEAPPTPSAPEVRPVTGAEVLGPNVPDVSMPWYAPGPIITRAQERETFSPAELADKIEQLRQRGWTPEQLQQAIENLSPEPAWTRQEVFLATQEDVARRAYELNGDRIKSGQPGTALDDWRQAQQELSQATKPPPVTQGESEPWVSAIANKYTQERTARGELGEVTPGEGASTEALLAQGLKMGPEQINQHVSDLMNNRGGDPVAQAAAIRAEEARLSQRSAAAARASETDPANQQLRVDADNAFKDLTDFHNGPVATLKNNWHKQGMGLQGEMPIDLSNFNGMREAFLKDVGKAPPPEAEPALRQAAESVRNAADAEDQAMRNLGIAIEGQTRGRTLPTADEVRDRIMQRMKNFPC